MAEDNKQVYKFGEYTKKPKNLTQYKLMKGVTDFGQLEQFNLYETGYSFLVVCKIPTFLKMLKEKDAKGESGIASLIDTYVHILENEFKGLSGLEDMSVETLEITDGISSLNVIGKVTQQSASTVSMTYTEKSGSVLTKVNELYLRGIKDPRTQVKHYHGLLADGSIAEAGYEHEVFTFLYFVTDNTAREIEKAYLLMCAQPTKAELSMYESTKGDIGNKELSMEFNCVPVTGELVDKKAKEVLDIMNSKYDSKGTLNSGYVEFNSTHFDYSRLADLDSITKTTEN